MLMKIVELSAEEFAVQFFEIEKILQTRPRLDPSFLSWIRQWFNSHMIVTYMGAYLMLFIFIV